MESQNNDVSASAVGAMHRRERFFLFAYSDRGGHVHGESEIEPAETGEQARRDSEPGIHAADTYGQRCDDGNADRFGRQVLQNEGGDDPENQQERDERECRHRSDIADAPHAPRIRCQLPGGARAGRIGFTDNPESAGAPDPRSAGNERMWSEQIPEFKGFSWCKDIRSIEDLQGRPDIPVPLVRGGADGVPNRVERTKCLGNSVVPQIAETIGYWMLEWIRRREA